MFGELFWQSFYTYLFISGCISAVAWLHSNSEATTKYELNISHVFVSILVGSITLFLGFFFSFDSWTIDQQGSPVAVSLVTGLAGYLAWFFLAAHLSGSSSISAPNLLYLFTCSTEAFWGIYRLVKQLWWVFIALAMVSFVWVVFGLKFNPNAFGDGPMFELAGKNWFILMWVVVPLVCFWQQLGPVLDSITAWIRRTGEVDAAMIDFSGAVAPDVDQQTAINKVLSDMKDKLGDERWKELIKPEGYLIIPGQFPTSYTVGRWVFFTSAVVDGNAEYLPALMAHEWGQIQQGTGSVYAALRLFSRQVLWEMAIDRGVQPAGSISSGAHQSLGRDADFVFRRQAHEMRVQLAKDYGGIGLHSLQGWWSRWFADQYYEADFFTVQFDYHYKLAELLKRANEYAGPVPHFLNFRPYPNLRLEQLKAFLNAPPRPVVFAPPQQQRQGNEVYTLRNQD